MSTTALRGVKVSLPDAPNAGVCEILGPDVSGWVDVAFFTTPTRHICQRVELIKCSRVDLPLQTRCYFLDGCVPRNGRIVAAADRSAAVWTYRVQFPARGSGADIRTLLETEFRVRSGLPTGDPTETLAELSHETPFFFEYRSKWVVEYVRQVRLAGGLTGPLSAPVDLFPHQAEVVGRVLRDPEIRYLLADEVGLGKTVETGLILRQLQLDAPHARIAVFAPEPLVPQWNDELTRLGLTGVRVSPHARLVGPAERVDVAVIDEAHRVVADSGRFAGARALCTTTRHVLLLSATPVLHHEAEMLALLHLLSPEAYRLEDLDAFRDRVRVRRDLGRVLLALSTASSSLVLKSQLRRLADLLPNDPVAAAGKALVESGAPQDRLKAEAAAVHTHASETYRLYRRMLRSRRSALVADGSVAAERKLHPALVARDPSWADLWARLDEWRAVRAAEVPESDAAATDYLRLGSALATDRDWCLELLETRLGGVVSGAERGALDRLCAALAEPPSGPTRIEVLCRALVSWHSTDSASRRKYVVFCDEPSVCNWIAQGCGQQSLALNVAVAHGRMSSAEFDGAVRRFRDEVNCHILIADRTAEEGLNFTFAYRVVMFDLPFEPLRLEQRLGRLDRLTRSDDVNVHVVVSQADPEVALDAAWLSVLDTGFGVFAQSASDVQIAIHRETVRLRRVAFTGGPAALSREAGAVATAVAAERTQADEQDAIDGLQLGSAEAGGAYRGLRDADRAANDFGEAIRGYWRDPLRLEVIKTGRPNVVEYGSRKHNITPLLPLDRFLPFKPLLNLPSTVSRGTAMAHPGVQFVRPGQAFADELWRLAEWDDRGRAFALWRQLPGQIEPRFVFRVAVLTGLELPQLTESLDAAGYDDLARANLLRLVGSWFQARYDEVFLDELGAAAPDQHADYCREENYDSDIDQNLSDDGSAILVQLFGADTWPALCRRARDAALAAVTRSAPFVADQAQALARAGEHFRVVRARLRARAGAAESAETITAALAHEDRLEAAVLELIRAPLRTCDAIGFYVLSDAPPESPATD